MMETALTPCGVLPTCCEEGEKVLRKTLGVQYMCKIGRWVVKVSKQCSNLGKRWLKEEMGSSRTLGEQPNYTLARLIKVRMWGLLVTLQFYGRRNGMGWIMDLVERSNCIRRLSVKETAHMPCFLL